ncbi:MAG: hypothetical protein FJ406_04330 [Verrucomicrobia bacterium]|nr:hypothetical protein [Verrucomicrobiota bacterium]
MQVILLGHQVGARDFPVVDLAFDFALLGLERIPLREQVRARRAARQHQRPARAERGVGRVPVGEELVGGGDE